MLILISLRTHKECIENLLALTAILEFDYMFYKVLTDADQMVISTQNQLPFLTYTYPKLFIEVNKQKSTGIEPTENLQSPEGQDSVNEETNLGEIA